MKVKRLHYNVSVELTFTEEEINYLIERAQRHYDSTCQAAGTSYEDGAQSNGFIKQLRLFYDLQKGTATWTSREIDLALKCIEPIISAHMTKTYFALNGALRSALERIEKRQFDLQKEEALAIR